jgi:hypothetical protein
LSRRDRQATVEQLSAVACIGLKQNRSYVRFEELEAAGDDAGTIGAVQEELRKLGRGFDVKLAAIWGTRLGLVEARRDGVWFPHSILQAYLGSRLINVAMADRGYLEEALADPGHELLIALVMHSRTKVLGVGLNGGTGRTAITELDGGRLRDILVEAAARRYDVKALDLYTAALEIDSIDEAPAHVGIAEKLRRHWPDISGRDELTLKEAKVNLVRSFGRTARAIAERRRKNEPHLTPPAYQELYWISTIEPFYPIRLAAAQEIGAGGDEAFVAMQGILDPHHPSLADEQAGGAPRTNPALPEQNLEREECRWREMAMRAWLAPQLVGSATSTRVAARDSLVRWLEFVATTDSRSGAPDLRLSLEVALAQGFKYAANRRVSHPHMYSEASADLQEQAMEMLRGASFWFTRLTLLHALCLWSLPTGSDMQRFSRVRGADPRALVEHWSARPDAQPDHPFVVEARKLVLWALQTGQPERFIWIDESSIVAQVGSWPASLGLRRKHHLWIPPSAGWTMLHPRAQKLVADVFLLLNLAERGGPSDRNRRLRFTNKNYLPPCLAGERDPLDPVRSVVMSGTSAPGSTCRDSCAFGLCPYPPKDEQEHRLELSEAFCHGQLEALVSRGLVRPRTAPWQEVSVANIRRFWNHMRQRAQPS